MYECENPFHRKVGDMSRRITIRLSDDEYEYIERLADKSNTSKSDVVRQSVLSSSFDSQTIEKLDSIKNQFFQNIGKIEIANNRIGNNLNQIAKIYNQGKLPKDIEIWYQQFAEEFQENNQILELIVEEVRQWQ